MPARPGTIEDEELVPAYTLPDLLGGVSSREQWQQHRRPELLGLFQEHVYGFAPTTKCSSSFEVMSADVALGGLATRQEIRLTLEGRNGVQRSWVVLIYSPRACRGAAPCFLGLNFSGNQTVHTDPGITVSNVVEDKFGTPERVARGAAAARWQVEKVLSHGFALATVYSGDIAPDCPDTAFSAGVHALFDDHHSWGTIAAWSWGLCRTLDLFELLPTIDHSRCALIGHSRKGKAALWAGAIDERFALVISNNSGCGGAALSRRAFGETIAVITHSFPHWFASKFSQYGAPDPTSRPGREADLPVDQHQLIALIAPRPVYVASAEDDSWADPKGEFMAAVAAEPAYRILGKPGFSVSDQDAYETTGTPPVDVPIGVKTGCIGYHRRSGGHDVTAFDWEQYLKFAARHFAVKNAL